MPDKAEGGSPRLPEPHEIIEGIAKELGLDPQKKPLLEEKYPTKQLFSEEAPTADSRYIANACLEQIYTLSLGHTPPGRPLLLSPGDVRWLYREFRQSVEQAWEVQNFPEPIPEFTLTHLFGASKRQIAHLNELKRFHETAVFDPAIEVFQIIGHVVERAILDGDPDPQYLADAGDL
jgi:hypothetical protein